MIDKNNNDLKITDQDPVDAYYDDDLDLEEGEVNLDFLDLDEE